MFLGLFFGRPFPLKTMFTIWTQKGETFFNLNLIYRYKDYKHGNLFYKLSRGYYCMIKKVLAALLTLALVVTPVGSFMMQGHGDYVSAKSYKSGKKGFSNNNGSSSSNNSLFSNQKKDTDSKQNSSAAKKNDSASSKSGGFMKGMLFGGLAGLMLGGLLGNMGAMGAVLGLLINIIAVVAVFMIIRKLFQMYINKRLEKERERRQWNN